MPADIRAKINDETAKERDADRNFPFEVIAPYFRVPSDGSIYAACPGTLLATLSRYAAWEFSWGCSLLSWNALFVMLFVLLWHTI